MQNDSQEIEANSGLETVVFIRDELGLHARPAAKLAQAAQQFDSSISIEYENMTADAKSILDILSLAAGRGASLKLKCSGSDADSAVKTLEELFNQEGGLFVRNG